MCCPVHAGHFQITPLPGTCCLVLTPFECLVLFFIAGILGALLSCQIMTALLVATGL